MKKRNDEVGHLQQMNITTEGRYHQQTYTNVSSSSERPKTPQRYNTPKKKNKGIRN